MSREYVSTKFDCRRISVIVHRSASDNIAVDLLVLLVCGLGLIPPPKKKVSGKLYIYPVISYTNLITSYQASSRPAAKAPRRAC